MTGNEASYREKGRAVFLAAMMVLSVVAMTAAFSGAAAATNDELDPDSDLDDQDFYIGEELVINVSDHSSNWFDVYQGVDEDGERVDQVRKDGDTLTVETEDFEEGPYVITNASDDEMIHDDPFVMNEMVIDAEFDESSVEEDEDTTVDLEIEFTEGVDSENYYNVTIVETSDALDEEEIEKIFGAEDTLVNEDDEVEITVKDEDVQNLEADFSEVEVGEYEFEIESVDTGASDTAALEVQEEGATNIEFVDRTLFQNAGDVAEIEIAVDNTDQLYLEIDEDHEEEPYWANLTIEDGIDDSENVVIEFNTFTAGHEDSEDIVTIYNGDDDIADYEFHDRDLPDDFRLQPEEFDLEVFEDNDSTSESSASLELEERSTDDISTYIAPASGQEELDDVDAIEDAISSYNDVAEGDQVVFEVEASGIYGYLYDEDNGDWDPYEQNLTLDVTSTEQPRFSEPASLEEIDDNDAMDLVVDADENRFFVVMDTDEVEIEDEDDGLGDEEAWEVTFTVGEDNPYVDADEEVVTDFTVEEDDIDFGTVEGNYQVVIDDDYNMEVRGDQTYLAPGTEVEVTADSRYFVAEKTVYVEADEDGERSFTVEFEGIDDDRVEIGHTFELIGESPESTFERFTETAEVAEEPEWETVTDAEQLEQLIDEIKETLDVEDDDEIVPAIEDLQNENDELNEEIDELNEEIDELNEEIDELEDEKADLEQQIVELNEQIDEMYTEEEVEEKTSDLNEKIDELEDEKADLNKEIAELEDEKADLNKEIAELNDKIDEMYTEEEVDEKTSDLNEKIDELEGDLADFEDLLDEYDVDSIEDLKDLIDEGTATVDDDDNGADDGDDGSPGFGVAVALAALIGAAMMAIRRQN